jgi:7-cyano-7-deazaguanine reductase
VFSNRRRPTDNLKGNQLKERKKLVRLTFLQEISTGELIKVQNSTQQEDLSRLTLLGREAKPSKSLETFPNRHPDRDYVVTMETDEFTCVCPMPGQPDFAHLQIRYIPDASILESKSLKLYLWSYRNEGIFHEHVTNVILEDLIAVLSPRWCKVTAHFGVRGGISITVEAEYTKPGTAQP